MGQTLMSRGRFITIEGGEGVGKSTLITSLKTWLESQGIKVYLTREPGGTPFGEQVRALLLHYQAEVIDHRAELLLFLASRIQHIETVIRPALERGQWVLCDRFMDSTLVYQGQVRGLGIGYIEQVWKSIYDKQSLVPDLTLLLDCPVSKAFERIGSRIEENNRFEAEGLKFHEDVRSAFLALAKAHQKRIHVLNADQTPDQIFISAQYAIQPIL